MLGEVRARGVERSRGGGEASEEKKIGDKMRVTGGEVRRGDRRRDRDQGIF